MKAATATLADNDLRWVLLKKKKTGSITNDATTPSTVVPTDSAITGADADVIDGDATTIITTAATRSQTPPPPTPSSPPPPPRSQTPPPPPPSSPSSRSQSPQTLISYFEFSPATPPPPPTRVEEEEEEDEVMDATTYFVTSRPPVPVIEPAACNIMIEEAVGHLIMSTCHITSKTLNEITKEICHCLSNMINAPEWQTYIQQQTTAYNP